MQEWIMDHPLMAFFIALAVIASATRIIVGDQRGSRRSRTRRRRR